MTIKNLLFCSLLFLIYISHCTAKNPEKVKLEKIQVLTLHSDQWTTGRRSSPIKQLSCVGGYCGKARVTHAQCYNRGFDGRDVQWECKAEMPGKYKFGRIEVICEGYDYPEDEYVLVGSCGMEYTIEETGSDQSSNSNNYFSNKRYDSSSSGSFWPIFIIIALIALIYFTCLRNPSTDGANTGSYSSDDHPRPSAPPPPGFRSDYYDSGDSCNRSSGSSFFGGSSTGTSSRPGFYSGMAAGGLLGYLFGSSRSNTNTYNRPYGGGYQSGWDYGPSTSGYQSSSSSTSGGGGSNTHTSSGFGSTRRR